MRALIGGLAFLLLPCASCSAAASDAIIEPSATCVRVGSACEFTVRIQNRGSRSFFVSTQPVIAAVSEDRPLLPYDQSGVAASLWIGGESADRPGIAGDAQRIARRDFQLPLAIEVKPRAERVIRVRLEDSARRGLAGSSRYWMVIKLPAYWSRHDDCRSCPAELGTLAVPAIPFASDEFRKAPPALGPKADFWLESSRVGLDESFDATRAGTRQ